MEKIESQKIKKPQEKSINDKLFSSFVECNKFVESVKRKDKNAVSRIKNKFIKKHPEEIEAAEILFSFPEFFETQRKLDKMREESKKRMLTKEEEDKKLQHFKNLTQYWFLVAHFIHENIDKKEMLSEFWESIERTSHETGYDSKNLKRGTLTQVATMRVFEKLGLKSELSHPKEDAFNAIDLWVEGNAIQIKGTKTKKDVDIVEVDSTAFPGVQTEQNNNVLHFNSHFFYAAQKFKIKTEEYQKELHRPFHSYFVIIPYGFIDNETGEPKPELIEKIREKLNA
jgi:hypothetical protein